MESKLEDPCETCLVRACCKIRIDKRIYKCGCENYESYRIKMMIKDYEIDNLSFPYTNLKNRLSELNENK